MSDRIIFRNRVQINGIVQGVGFRPFIYRIAKQCNLAGFINNDSDGVLIEVQGSKESLNEFLTLIKTEAPPLSKITNIEKNEIATNSDKIFQIVETKNKVTATTLISPDVSVCEDCLNELTDPNDRRFKYPFINCTNCGPRYTIVKSIPYDRPFTSMAVFPMCPACEKEYRNPEDRRFHAQPNACPDCGPQLSLFDGNNQKITSNDPISETVQLLQKGKIVAIRGLGGFHLVVDAFNEKAVQELRIRKGRQGKPFALMAPSIASIKKYCLVSVDEEKFLNHHTRPIVLLKAKKSIDISDSIAPGNNYLGFMLPYTPLHFLLMEQFNALVMTSANFTDEPIAIKNDEAVERLTNIADYFLLHDRDILQRCDDSIIRVVDDKARLIRRSRGFVPEPVFIKNETQKNILAVGAELKNTFALSRKDSVFFSQHIGDLDNPSAYNFFEHSIDHLQNILQIKPQVIACDMHPEYLSTKWAKKQDLPILEIQHHHAHLASVMAENKISSPTIGLILDGTGFGTDGTIWGGEVLIGDFNGFERFAWLEPVAMPGGSMAIKQPWRMALSYLFKTFGEGFSKLELPFLKQIPDDQIILIEKMVNQNLNSPLTSSCGRLFDAISAMLGICSEVTFEAEAAIKMEMILDETVDDHYDFAVNDLGVLSVQSLIKQVVDDVHNKIPVSIISAKFHNSLAFFFAEVAENARQNFKINHVALSGGVFQNACFFNRLVKLLRQKKFEIITHSKVPTNDGGLALGQIAIANSMLKSL
ncbi:MAG: carbamoyltransferase HypF [Calditrichaeota bacterium]|nr:carbamoyltransferase HypF [Calditrichota bacterium]